MHLLDLSGALLPASPSSAILTLAGLLLFLYLCHVNHGLGGTPDVVERVAVKPWTEEELRETYDELKKNPIDVTPHLPPKQNRRYIVTGGTGLVGGAIVQQLLLRGEDPSLVRILDIRAPTPKVAGSLRRARDLSRAHFVPVDVGSKDSVDQAFALPWPSHGADLPLTVFHTAAVIRVSERHSSLLPLSSRVNETGTAHVLDAARAAGADVFVATSSGSIAIRPVNFWLAPWRRWPVGYYQRLTDADYDLRRPHGGYYGNYPESKARAEALVRAADDCDAGFRTGCIRPASGVYGSRFDNTVGAYLRTGGGPDWLGHIINNFVYTGNVALAHLLYEQTVQIKTDDDDDDDEDAHDLGGQAFTIVDPTPPIRFYDLHRLHLTLVHSPMRFFHVAPIIPFLLSYLIELYSLFYHLGAHPLANWLRASKATTALPSRMAGDFLAMLFPPLGGLPVLLQPALFGISSVHLDYGDELARRPQEEGGLGYEGAWGTMEGMVSQVVEWNEEWDELHGGKGKRGGAEKMEVRVDGEVPAGGDEGVGK
ncbi:3-beta hydroxysteroid dehydrogenase/isomerase family protein [Phyllosticta citricarpa]|uniref:3-beta hydroxysteroid dehydrogenase/isomerase family protein n=1 Tax=Phyllosticta citricarpa TaxID=55181 RepID=A0ABR1MF03_9PEZI